MKKNQTIPGPDYWNINKRWRLCSLGRKQSPVEIRTDRLVYDHLLGPIKFNWLKAGATNPDDSEQADLNDVAKADKDANVDSDDVIKNKNLMQDENGTGANMRSGKELQVSMVVVFLRQFL